MIVEKLLSCGVPPHTSIQGNKRACVSIILRASKSEGGKRSFQSIEDLRQYIRKQKNPIEDDILFIKRAFNPNDRWSGQIAFPGGRRSEADVSDLACVQRECMEEIGIDLSSRRYALLGQLNDRTLRSSTKSPFIISTFLFIDLDSSGNSFSLAEHEVEDVFWCNTRILTGETSRLSQLTLDTSSISLPSRFLRIAQILKISQLFFPCLYLKGQATAVLSYPQNYALWGLTFGMVSDLLSVAELPTFQQRKRTELRCYRHLSNDTIPFSTNSFLANVLLVAYYRIRDTARWLGSFFPTGPIQLFRCKL